MKTHLYRVLFITAAVVFIAPVFAAAQKKVPVDKSAAKSKVPSESKAIPPPDSKARYSKMELAVVEEINAARKNPQKFAVYLEQYKKATKGNLVSLPNRIPRRTVEGVTVFEEASVELKSVSALDALEISERLSDAAQMQLKDLQEDSTLGHKGKNGSNLKSRLMHFGGVDGKAAENICHRGETAHDVAMTFIIDDGVKSRMHRKNVFSPTFKLIGVACGSGKNNESLCVTVFAEKLKDADSTLNHVEF